MNFKIQNLNGLKKINQTFFSFFILFYFVTFITLPKIIARQPTPVELESIQKETRFVFENFLQLWQEERYFELYKYGAKKSIEQISQEEFATRMVELDWVPVGLESLKEPIISFRYKTLVYVTAEIIFQHKNYFDLKFAKQQSFLLIKEKRKWSFDLIQMIRSPFYSAVK